MKNQTKLAIAFFATCQLQIELIDELKGTNLYRHKLKNLCNQVQKENELLISSLFSNLDNDTELYLHKTVTCIESVVEAIKGSDIDTFMMLMEDFKNGEIAILDENKHNKIFKQLEKI